MPPLTRYTRIVLVVSLATGGSLCAAQERARPSYEGQGIKLSVSPRTPEQTTAFYAGRGFPQHAMDAIGEVCFVTVGLRNHRPDVLWLEPVRWRFIDADGRELRRLDRAYWTARWDELELPLANRATFGWTQLPEVRDLQPGEPVGGNVTILAGDGTFTLEARFHTGPAKQGEDIVVRVPGLSCPGREPRRPAGAAP